MIRSEVVELLVTAMACWPHIDLASEAVIARYVRDLADVDQAHAATAVETWYRDGNRFPPNGAEIVGRIADLALDVPSWGEVKAALVAQRAARVTVSDGCPLGECDGSMFVLVASTTTLRIFNRETRIIEETEQETEVARDCRCRADRLRARRVALARHPMVEEFLRLVGPAEVRDVLSGDRTAEAQVRTKYETFVRDVRRDVTYQGVDPAGLPGVERVLKRAAARQDRAQIGRPDFLKLVGGEG